MSIYVNVLVLLLLIKYALNHWPNIDRAEIQKLFLIISSAILALFTGLRDNYTGADTIGYGRRFLNARRYTDFWKAVELLLKNGEYGYGFWNRFWGRFTDNVNVYFTITAVVFAVCLAVYIYKNSQNPFFSMILYYTVGAFGFQLTGMRQALAMAILLTGFEFIKEKKPVKFLIVVYLASLFHNSAWSFIFAYPLARMKINFKNFILFAAGCVFFTVYSSPITKLLMNNTGYDVYEGSDFTNIGGEAVIGMLMLTIILCYIFQPQLVQQNGNNVIFFNLTFMSLIIYLLRYTILVFERVSFYYQFAFIILLPNAVEAIPDTKTRKTVYTCAIVLACALFFYRYQIKPSYYGFLWK